MDYFYTSALIDRFYCYPDNYPENAKIRLPDLKKTGA